MAIFRLSSGARNSWLGDAFFKGTSGTAELAYSDNGEAADSITDTQNRFLTAGIKVGDTFSTTGSTTAGNDETDVAVVSVAAGVITFATGTLAASEDFVVGTTLTFNNGGELKTLFKDCVIMIRSGTIPASADLVETGSALCLITVASGAFSAGVATNGLEWGQVISGVMSKNSDVWSGVGLIAAEATWARMYANAYTTGASTTAIRADMDIATSGTSITISDTTIVIGATTTVDTATITLPV